MVYLACSVNGEINAATYVALHTSIDYDGLLDILEMNQVQNSWNEATRANIK
jgi:hypothetical protein